MLVTNSGQIGFIEQMKFHSPINDANKEYITIPQNSHLVVTNVPNYDSSIILVLALSSDNFGFYLPLSKFRVKNYKHFPDMEFCFERLENIKGKTFRRENFTRPFRGEPVNSYVYEEV